MHGWYWHTYRPPLPTKRWIPSFVTPSDGDLGSGGVTATGSVAGALTTAITFAAACPGTASLSGRLDSATLYPNQDLQVGTWAPSTPATPLWIMLDESPYSDADYIYGDSADTPAIVGFEGFASAPSLTITLRWKAT